ncbi:MAG: SGNH/GDSL hydrolase family protein, partial [Clostridia bacterium]|nr:SGNH/GDSL hydrolase family protein [Clostridia bacterium]
MKKDFSQYINYIAPLSHTYNRLVKGKEINIVYFGGSITAGFGSSNADKLSWRAKTDKWFNENFSDCKINSINSSIGESGTYLGVFRLGRDVISQKPDLLFIEYAINDLSHEATRESAAMQLETIVREVKATWPDCDIVVVLTEAESTYMEEHLYPAAQGHEDVAIHYNLPSVHVGKALASYLRQNADKAWSDYFIDTVHPNDNGYGFYYECVEEYLHNSLISSVPAEQKQVDTVPMLSSQLLDGQRYYITDCSIFLKDSCGFECSDDVYMNLQATPYVGYVYTDSMDAELCIGFYGTELGIYTNFSHYLFSGDVEVSVNNGGFEAVNCSAHNPTLLVKDLPEGNYYVRIRPVFTDKTPDVFKIAAVFTRNNAAATRRTTTPADKNEFFAMPARDIAGSAANPDTHKYQLCENDIMVRRIYIDTTKGGGDVDLMLLADTHLNHLNIHDFEEKNPVVLSTNEYRLGFKGHSTFINLDAVMEYAPLFDKTIVLGDVVDYLT